MLIDDLRFGAGLLWKQKALSLAAIATLGVCLAAATAIFSIVNAVVLRPLPFSEPDRLAFLYDSYPRAGVEVAGSGVPDYYDCRAETGLFEEVAIFRARGQTIGAGDNAERQTMMTMTPSLFRLVRDVIRTLYLMWGGSFLVLPIGCVNIANLTLVRASRRLKELATRYALGARLGQLARQTVAEAVIGGALGFLLGRWGLALVRTLGLERLPRAFEIAFDAPVLLYTLGLVVGISVFVGLVPMASLRQRTLGLAVREESRTGTASRGAHRARRALVMAQVALALVLLAGPAPILSASGCGGRVIPDR